ncbi:unnamed protein product [Sphenostylis stenocarpa]|uniref:Uncharacterized protein n=1 Tax=Sphenostylis stenocarpa TaxID=92480 RepID=A0AA86W3X7_9FABA|nr:unnamed protein product [Sphenostylis stenocarpa]
MRALKEARERVRMVRFGQQNVELETKAIICKIWAMMTEKGSKGMKSKMMEEREGEGKWAIRS